MKTWLRAGGSLGSGLICLLVLLMFCGRQVEAQTVTTTNEVRAMRGLGPIGAGETGQSQETAREVEVSREGSSESRPDIPVPADIQVQLPTVGELQGE